MPSPDVAAYAGLTLVDLSEQDLIDQALASLGEKFPDWVPREGNTELVLLEEHAKMLADMVYAINRLPDGMTEILLRLFGLDRDQGAPPQAQVTFTLSDTLGHTIPAGTVVRIDLGATDPLDLVLEDDLVIASGDTAGTGLASGAEAGVTGNGQAAGTVLELLDSIPYVETVVLASDVAGGRAAEDGAAFLARTTPRLQRLTNTVVRPVDVETWFAENADVTRIRVLDLYDPDGANAPGDDLGHVTAAVAGSAGALILDATKATLRAQLAGAMHAGLSVHVVDADVTTVNVTITVLRYSYAVDADVQAAVEAAVRSYLDPDTWAWGDTVRVNELIAVADRAAGVDTVLSVGNPNADLPLDGFAPLAKAGTVTVVVDAP